MKLSRSRDRVCVLRLLSLPCLAWLLLLACQWCPAAGQDLGDTGQGCEEEEERSFDSEVRVATLQFEELQVVLLVVVFILLVVFAKMGESSALEVKIISFCYTIPPLLPLPSSPLSLSVVWHHHLMLPVSSNIPESW